MTLAEDYRKEFEVNGHVVVPDVLSAAEVREFREAVEAAVQHRKRFDSRRFEEKSPYEQSFIQCQNLWEDFASVRRLTFHLRIAELAADILGVKRLRLWHDQALIKEAGGVETKAHQDFPYWPIACDKTITAWVPFDGASRDNGCLSFLSGSHRLGVTKFADIFRGKDIDSYLDDKAFGGLSWQEAPVPSGGVSFHHGLTVHRASANVTDVPRVVHTMIFFEDGAVRAGAAPHPSVDRPGIGVGEKVESALTPLVWPRADEDLPKPPNMPMGEAGALGQRFGVYPPDPE